MYGRVHIVDEQKFQVLHHLEFNNYLHNPYGKFLEKEHAKKEEGNEEPNGYPRIFLHADNYFKNFRVTSVPYISTVDW